MSALRKGQVCHVVDQTGATFAFLNRAEAEEFYDSEQQGGSENLSLYAWQVARDGMSLAQVADDACENGPNR